MQPGIWQHQLAQAKQMFHPEMFELIEKIKQPFVSLITSTANSQASFFNDRVFMIGDALAQKQPNTAQGVNFAAKNALDLADMVAGKMTARQWEQLVVGEGERERARSVAFGSWYLSTWVGWAWPSFRYQWVLRRQGFWDKWWYGTGVPATLQTRSRELA